MFRSVTLALLATAVPALASAQTFAFTGASPANTVGACGMGTPTPCDTRWTVQSAGVLGNAAPNDIAQRQATLITTPPTPPWQPNGAGYNWIGVSTNANQPFAQRSGDNAERYKYLFQHTFTPTAAFLDVALGWDNRLVSILQGTVTMDNAGVVSGGTAVTVTGLTLPQTQSGFCRNPDGILPPGDFPNCTVNVRLSGFTPDVSTTLSIVTFGDGNTDGILVAPQVVPEPSTYALLATGLAGLGLVARRRRSA